MVAVIFAVPAQNGPRTLTDDENNFYERSVSMSLAPAHPFAQDIETGLQDLDPRVGIEISLEIPVAARAFTDSGRVAVFNILRSVSTMEGIEYYSASRGEMRTFYEESYAIESPDNRNRIPDPRVDAIPTESTVWAYQRDGSFGRNVQRLDYRATDGAILVSIENETTMVYTVVPLVRPGNLRTYLLVVPDPVQQVFRFYGNLGVRVPAVFGMEDRARDSFYNRIVALHDWFVRELQRADLTSTD